MSLPFDSRRIRAYEFEFAVNGNRLGCKFFWMTAPYCLCTRLR
jgi:hypothetical protein